MQELLWLILIACFHHALLSGAGLPCCTLLKPYFSNVGTGQQQLRIGLVGSSLVGKKGSKAAMFCGNLH